MTDTGVRIERIPTIPSMGRSIIEHDPKSREYPARGALMEAGVRRATRNWRRGSPPYNQGQSSSCVGQALKGVLNTSPSSDKVAANVRTKYSALEFYRGGQENDEWPGEEPQYFGTSALGVCKYLTGQGIIREYRWCFGVDDVLDTLSQYGPVAVGLNWTHGMLNPAPNGFLTVDNDKVGGHETELIGINVEQEYVIGENSWGVNWGLKGRYKLTWTALDALLQDSGDAVTVVAV